MTLSTLETESLKAMLDIAIESMNFNSGMLDQEEVSLLRQVAVLVGVDPILATPQNFTKQWAHTYEPYIFAQWSPYDPTNRKDPYTRLPDKELCLQCQLDADDPIHHGVDNIAKSEEAQ